MAKGVPPSPSLGCSRDINSSEDKPPPAAPSQGLHVLLLAAKAQHRTSAAVVTDTLRKAIIQGVIAGGVALRQDDLAATLAVSRMPIREALRQLEVEGLVEFTAHKGAVVATLDPDDVEEIAEIRVALEGLALTLSFPHLTPSILDEAEAVLDRMDGEPSLLARSALNRAFHALLYSGVHRRRLERQIWTLYNGFDRYLRLEHSVLDRRETSQQEHRRILAACRRRNLAVAVGELRHHISDAGSGLSAFLRDKS